MNMQRRCIARGGEAAWTSPSGFANARLYCFEVKADGALVHEMWTRYIGRPSQDLGLHVDVRGNMFDRVFFVFLDSDRHQLGLKAGPGSEGRQHEQLFAIVVPGYRRHPDPGLVLFAPYVYSSDTPGWRAEREIFGYPQQRGRVHIQPDHATLPSSLSVETPVIVRFAETAMTEVKTILHIVRKPVPARAAPIQTGPQGAIARAIARTLEVMPVVRRGHGVVPIVPHPRLGITAADASFFTRCSRGFAASPGPTPDTGALLEAWRSGSMPMLFLKQFRDVVQSDRACYQAIVEAKFKIRGNAREIPLKDYVLDLEDTDSAPIRCELGIRSGKVPVDYAFRLDLEEMSIGDAKVVSNPYWSPAVEASIPDTPSRLPRYVDRGGEAVWRQPSLLQGARIYGFGVPVSEENQKALLKRCVNDVAGHSDSTYGSRKFELHPVPGLDMIMLLFVDYKRISSANDDDKRLGGTRYREFLAMQLALSADEEFPELDWVIPFIYLDTDSPRLAGREVFGYPKQLGTIAEFKRYRDGNRELEPAKELELSATVIHDASQTRAAYHRVVRIEGPPGPPAIRKRYLGPQEMLLDLIDQIGDDSRTRGVLQHLPTRRVAGASGSRGRAELLNALLFSNVGNVFLKQFRDCTTPEFACYQAVCKTDTIPANFHGGGSLDPSHYRIKIENHLSEPLLNYINGAEAPGPPATITPVFAYWLDLDVELTNGRVLANPLEAPFVPDLSPGRTPRDTRVSPRMVRRSHQVEL